MAVIVKYIVERNGEEVMSFATKVKADNHDKMLDIADEIFILIEQSKLIPDEKVREELAVFLAGNKDALLIAMGSKRKPLEKIKEDKIKEDKTPIEAGQTGVKPD